MKEIKSFYEKPHKLAAKDNESLSAYLKRQGLPSVAKLITPL